MNSDGKSDRVQQVVSAVPRWGSVADMVMFPREWGRCAGIQTGRVVASDFLKFLKRGWGEKKGGRQGR